MADINISELPPISSATSDDVFIINDANATTSRINWQQLQQSITSLSATQVKFLSGTESDPSITFVGDLNTGIYNPGLDQIGLVTNGTSRIHIDAAGKVGIGTKQPSSYTTSLNDLVVGNIVGDAGIVISSSDTDVGVVSFSDSLSAFPGAIGYDHDDDHMYFTVNGLEKARINQVGNFGVGTSSPQERLHVRSGVSGITGTQGGVSGIIVEGASDTETAVQFFTPSDTSAGLFFSDPSNFGIGHLKYDHTNNRFAFQTNNVESVYIDSTGSVGIGSVPSDRALSITKQATGASSYSGIHVSSEVQSDVNLDFRYFRSSATTQATGFTLIDLYHFSATQDTLGAGSTVTNQFGFAVDSGMTGATNNYGFFSNLPQGSNTYNFYSNGTADNYFNGDTFTIANGGTAAFTVNSGLGTFAEGLVLTPGNTSGRPSPAPTGTLRFNSDFNNVEAYDGTAWGSIGGSIDTSPTPPTNAVNGDMWFDTDEGRTYVYYDDGDSVQWVEMNPSLNGGISNNSVTTSSLVDSAVSTPKIADGAVTTPKIANGAVTPAKLDRTYAPEAPNDGTSYVRRNEAWIAAAGAPSVAASFPTPVTIGQQFYSLSDGRLYIAVENASSTLVWVDSSPDNNMAQVYTGVNPPVGPENGAMWWDSESGRMFVYYVDTNADSQWVEASPQVTGFTYDEGTDTWETGSNLSAVAGTFAGGKTAIRASDGRVSVGNYNTEQSTAIYDGNVSIARNDGATALSIFNAFGSNSPNITLGANGLISSSNSNNSWIERNWTGASGDAPAYTAFQVKNNGTAVWKTACNGDTFIGGADINSPNIRLSADGSSYFKGEIRVERSSTCVTCITGGGDGTALLYFQTNQPAELGKIRRSGNGVAYDTTSDYRLKENFEPISDAISRVKSLNPLRFNFIEYPELTVDGFIAHEVKEVVPESVDGTKDEVNDEGSPVYQTMDQSKLVPLLTAALQEAVAKIETLEARLNTLEEGLN